MTLPQRNSQNLYPNGVLRDPLARRYGLVPDV